MAKATQAAPAKSLKKTVSKPAAKSAPKPALKKSAAPKKPALSILTSQVELVKYLADRLEVSQVQAKDFLDTFKEILAYQLKKAEKWTLNGVGTFQVVKRAARTGRNPRTGETLKIKAGKNIKFKASKTLKDAVI